METRAYAPSCFTGVLCAHQEPPGAPLSNIVTPCHFPALLESAHQFRPDDQRLTWCVLFSNISFLIFLVWCCFYSCLTTCKILLCVFIEKSSSLILTQTFVF